MPFGIGGSLKKYGKKYGGKALLGIQGASLLGLGGGPKMPKSPNPLQVAQQQIGIGQQVQGMNAPNQTGIFGGTEYERNAAGGITGVKTSLSPEMQAIYESLRGGLGTRPGDVSDAIYGQYTSRLDPQYAQGQAALETQLANQGITRGSEAYNNAMTQFGNQRTDAYAGARRDATTAGSAERTSLLNSMFGLGNAATAGYQNTPQIQTPNIADMVYKNFGAKQDKYNAGVGQQNAMMNGLFSLGAAAIGASDRRLKSNIVRVGTHKLGIGVYEYDIFGERQRGVMAQEVLEVMPSAVVMRPDGFMAVNYGAING